jgi:hypothetical protein
MLCFFSLSRLGAVSLLCLLFLTSAQAQQPEPLRVQDHNTNAWLMYFSDARLSNRWGVHTEAQWRRARTVRDPLQNFFRLGGNFHLTETVMLTAGYAYALTFPYGDFPAAGRFPEHRIYQQVLFKSAYGRLAMHHRYRLEQRWLGAIQGSEQSDYTYVNRTRYQFRVAVPLLGGKSGPGMPYAVLSDEVFVNFGRSVQRNIFDQNRAYAALGYQLTPALAVELGYLHQLLQQRNGRVFEYNNTLQVNLTFNPDLRRGTE